MNRVTVNKIVLLLVVIFISAIFFSMIRYFLMAIFLAGITSALIHPVYRYFVKLFRGHKGIASLITLILLVLIILLPLGSLLGIITAQALKVGQSIRPWIEQTVAQPDVFSNLLKGLPFYDQIEPYGEQILTKVGEMIGTISSFLLDSLSSVTVMTVNFVFMSFVFLYTLFFFLMDGEKLLDKILYYIPLEDKDERKMLDKFTSVTRATLKGTAVIGIIQGGLAGLAFAVVGIDGAVFWGTIMTVLSIIPGIGSALIWVPAGIILAAGGRYWEAVGLIAFCGLVVGSIDNLLRPRLVGRDTEMHELLIFFSTLGGLILFGVMGFIVGPIIAALFVTVWEIYGDVFKDVLPDVVGTKKSKHVTKK
jgi:predicted PurR-regulated permease PerM